MLALIGVLVGALDSPWLALSAISLAFSVVFFVVFAYCLIQMSAVARRREEREMKGEKPPL